MMRWAGINCCARNGSVPIKKGGLPGNDLRTEYEKDYHRIIGSGDLIREIHVEPQRS